MSAYRTVVVGTDGSASSLRAVHRAGALAGAVGARLVVACAYRPPRVDQDEDRPAQEVLGEAVHEVVGLGPAEGRVRTTVAEAREAGATDVHPVATIGSPVETLLDLAGRERAGLLVVGDRGLRGLRGRVLGSVPAELTRRSPVDVLVVHTTG
ncbi:universal stress protein [Geodermatophilus sp. SYSU D00758]